MNWVERHQTSGKYIEIRINPSIETYIELFDTKKLCEINVRTKGKTVYTFESVINDWISEAIIEWIVIFITFFSSHKTTEKI